MKLELTEQQNAEVQNWLHGYSHDFPECLEPLYHEMAIDYHLHEDDDFEEIQEKVIEFLTRN